MDINEQTTREQPPIIELENVVKQYSEGVDALHNVNLTIEKGEFVFIVGRSGSGKSTLIKLLMKEIEPTSGNITINGRVLPKLRHKNVPKYRRGIGVVFQDFRLLNDRTVFENIALAQRLIGVSKKKMHDNVIAMLQMVGLESKVNAYPKELSGGERQRVALARAMINRPAILLADEPTGNLDPKNAWSIMELIYTINRLGTTVLVVTHNNEIVDVMKKRVITLKNGVVMRDQTKGGYRYEKN